MNHHPQLSKTSLKSRNSVLLLHPRCYSCHFSLPASRSTASTWCHNVNHAVKLVGRAEIGTSVNCAAGIPDGSHPRTARRTVWYHHTEYCCRPPSEMLCSSPPHACTFGLTIFHLIPEYQLRSPSPAGYKDDRTRSANRSGILLRVTLDERKFVHLHLGKNYGRQSHLQNAGDTGKKKRRYVATIARVQTCTHVQHIRDLPMLATDRTDMCHLRTAAKVLTYRPRLLQKHICHPPLLLPALLTCRSQEHRYGAVCTSSR